MNMIGIPGDYVFNAAITSSQVPELWDLIENKIADVWAKGITGRGVKVAVLDTGFTPHPLLPDPVAARNFTSGQQDDVTDRNGHGNWCNGRTVGRGGVGIAPGADLIVAKVLDDGGRGRTDWTQDARVWAAQKGADVTSVSIGGPGPNPGGVESFRDAHIAGNVIECDAAGNAGFNGRNTIDYPGKYMEGLCVGAYRRDGRIANFSSGGREIDVATPGEQVISTSHWGSGFAAMSGTSMATPFMAGLCALILHKLRIVGIPDSEIRGAQSWRDFLNRPEFIDDAGDPGVDPRFGLGKPRILRIVEWLGDYESV